MTEKSYYITTPIYYVNDKPHIGHAYTSVLCSALSHFEQLRGKQTFFLTGTDEHGNKVAQSAQKQNLSPQEFVDHLVPAFQNLLDTMQCKHDHFIRTTDDYHKTFIQDIWRKMDAAGDIYLGKYAGWYAVRDECFYQENELVDGMAPTGAAVEWVEEETYFFRLSEFQNKLLEFYEHNPDFIYPLTRRNEVLSFVKKGLKDLSISRTAFDWGITVPDAIKSTPSSVKHVVYVWLDALFNYVSAAVHKNRFDDLWPCDLHVVGKDILMFHAVYWPAFLMSAGIALPKKIFAHGWWTNDGQKISKSLGNVIDPIALANKFSSDYVRYFLLREVPSGSDGNYSENALINRINAELVNNIGNLCHRVFALTVKKCDAKIPTPADMTDGDRALLSECDKATQNLIARLENLEIHLAIEEIVRLGNACNLYIEKEAPWSLKNARLHSVLYVLLQGIKTIGILLQPFAPTGATKILDTLNISQTERNFESKSLASGSVIAMPDIIFARIEK